MTIKFGDMWAWASLLRRINALKVVGLSFFKNYFDLARCRILPQQLSVMYILQGMIAEWSG